MTDPGIEPGAFHSVAFGPIHWTNDIRFELKQH